MAAAATESAVSGSGGAGSLGSGTTTGDGAAAPLGGVAELCDVGAAAAKTLSCS